MAAFSSALPMISNGRRLRKQGGDDWEKPAVHRPFAVGSCHGFLPPPPISSPPPWLMLAAPHDASGCLFTEQTKIGELLDELGHRLPPDSSTLDQQQSGLGLRRDAFSSRPSRRMIQPAWLHPLNSKRQNRPPRPHLHHHDHDSHIDLHDGRHSSRQYREFTDEKDQGLYTRDSRGRSPGKDHSSRGGDRPEQSTCEVHPASVRRSGLYGDASPMVPGYDDDEDDEDGLCRARGVQPCVVYETSPVIRTVEDRSAEVGGGLGRSEGPLAGRRGELKKGSFHCIHSTVRVATAAPMMSDTLLFVVHIQTSQQNSLTHALISAGP